MSETLDPLALHHVRRTADRLADELAGVFSSETIERYLAESATCSVTRGSTCTCPCSRTASRASASKHSAEWKDES